MTTTSPRWLSGLLLVAAALTLASVAIVRFLQHPTPPPAAPTPAGFHEQFFLYGDNTPRSSALAELNDGFRKVYRERRVELLRAPGPIIVVEGDDVVLLHHGKREVALAVPRTYHQLKAIAHVPLATYLVVQPSSDAAGRKQRIDEYRGVVSKVAREVAKEDLAGLPREEVAQALQRSTALLDLAGASESLATESTNRFIEAVRPFVVRAAALAAKAQVDGLHQQVQTWRKQVSKEDWEKLRVVIMGSQMPRAGNVNVQYFAKLLGEKGEGSRIVYAESLWEEERALNLLGTHLVDTAIGRDFFGDERRMHRDLLSDATSEYLATLELSK